METKTDSKTILKTATSKTTDPNAAPVQKIRKSAKFDEKNVVNTYHPKNKDYGFMTIEEPKTPFIHHSRSSKKTQIGDGALLDYHNPDNKDFLLMNNKDVPRVPQHSGINAPSRPIDLRLLYKKLQIKAECTETSFLDTSEDDFYETMEERIRRLEFERRRKLHYCEYQTVQIARQLILDEFGEESEVEFSLNSEGYDRRAMGEEDVGVGEAGDFVKFNKYCSSTSSTLKENIEIDDLSDNDDPDEIVIHSEKGEKDEKKCEETREKDKKCELPKEKHSCEGRDF